MTNINIKNPLLTKKIVDGILNYLERTKQVEILPAVVNKLLQIAKKKKEAIVYSAVVLTNEELERINKFLQSYLNEEVTLKNEVSKRILGGMRIEIGDLVFDASILSEISKIKKNLQF